mgnify:CR=1 FL=1
MNANKCVYHIVTNSKMMLGQRIVFDNTRHNSVYGHFLAKEWNNSKGETCHDILKSHEETTCLCLNEDDTVLLYTYLDQTMRAVRETILELVRTQKYPQYPSRLSCLYAAKTYEDAMRWKVIFDGYHRKVLQIVKLRVNGNVFEGDASVIPGIETCSFSKKIEQAEQYWKGAQSDGLTEVLVDGIIEVEEIIKDYID